MGRRIRLGRALGVEIAVDWSWIFTFVLAAWTLVSLGGRLLPTLSSAVLTLLSGAAAIGLFASLAVHELAHGLGARACGVPVRRLTLFLFGGITDVERAPSSPRSEAIAAVAAPLTNAILGASLLALVLSLGGVPRLGEDVSPSGAALVFLAWLGGVNLAITALNLLPAYPLDGGRLVRAVLWRLTGDVERASRWAAWAGQVIGWSTVALGVVIAFAARGAGSAAGMWVAFLGWFLASAAAQAYQSILVQSALAGVTVGRLMRRRFRALPCEASVATAARAWPAAFGEVLAVVEGERFVGVVSMNEVQRVRADAWERTRVSEIAVRDEHLQASPRDAIADAHRMLTELDLDRLPVVEEGRLVGIVERADVDRWIESHAASPAAV